MSENQIVTYNDCNGIIGILVDIEGHQSVLSQPDIENVRFQKQKVQDLIISKQNNGSDEKYVTDLIIATTKVLNILKKGEYSI